jgi:hypothetical protein
MILSSFNEYQLQIDDLQTTRGGYLNGDPYCWLSFQGVTGFVDTYGQKETRLLTQSLVKAIRQGAGGGIQIKNVVDQLGQYFRLYTVGTKTIAQSFGTRTLPNAQSTFSVPVCQ